jgi:O-antigen/teichoic acid export membrane protein
MTYLAGGIKDSLDPYLVGVIRSPETAFSYALTTQSTDMVRNQIVGQLSSAMLPSLAHLHGEGKPAHYNRVILILFEAQALMAAISLSGVLIFNKAFVTLWMGKDRYAGTAVTALIALYGILYLTALLAYEVLYSMGLFWELAKVVWLDMAIRIPLTVVLVYFFGAWGVAAAAVIGQAVAWNGSLLVFVIRKLGMTREELSIVGRQTLKLIVFPLALAALFWYVAGLDADYMQSFRDNGRKLHGWLIFAAHGSAFMAIETALAVWLAPNLVRLIRKRGRIDDPAAL